MSEGIMIAIIGAIGVVLSAIIAGVFSLLKNDNDLKKKNIIKQKQKGRNNTQIGVQNRYKDGDGN